MTSKLPLGLLIIEVAAQAQLRGLDFSLRWVPRDQNTEADALTNENFRGFDPARRIEVPLDSLDFILLRPFLEFSAGFEAELEALRAARPAGPPRATLRPRRRVPLRLSDPG